MKKTKKKNATAPAKSKAAAKRNSNTTAAYVARPKRTGKRNGRRKRNPELLGVRMSTADFGMVLLAGLAGVTVTKMVPPMLPASLTETNVGRVLASGAVALGAGMLAQNMNPRLGLAVGFGGGMQTMSVFLNTFLPKVGGQIGLNGGRRPGMGVLTDVPWVPVFNPLTGSPVAAPQLAAAPAVMPEFVEGAASGVYPSPYGS